MQIGFSIFSLFCSRQTFLLHYTLFQYAAACMCRVTDKQSIADFFLFLFRTLGGKQKERKVKGGSLDQASLYTCRHRHKNVCFRFFRFRVEIKVNIYRGKNEVDVLTILSSERNRLIPCFFSLSFLLSLQTQS